MTTIHHLYDDEFHTNNQKGDVSATHVKVADVIETNLALPRELKVGGDTSDHKGRNKTDQQHGLFHDPTKKYDSYQPESSRTEKLICELLMQQSAPDIKVEIFDGNVLKFQYFITTFEAVVESKIFDRKGRLTRLINYTSGKPKELIKSCI